MGASPCGALDGQAGARASTASPGGGAGPATQPVCISQDSASDHATTLLHSPESLAATVVDESPLSSRSDVIEVASSFSRQDAVEVSPTLLESSEEDSSAPVAGHGGTLGCSDFPGVPPSAAPVLVASPPPAPVAVSLALDSSRQAARPEVSVGSPTRRSQLIVTLDEASLIRSPRPEVIFRGASRSSRPFRWPALMSHVELYFGGPYAPAAAAAGASGPSSGRSPTHEASAALVPDLARAGSAGMAVIITPGVVPSGEGSAQVRRRPDPFAVLW